jgi:hypothetical protein
MSDIVRNSIAVFDGQLVNPFTVRHDDGVFRIDTIAHALSMLCRYGGHTSEFYSVAEHCLLVELIVRIRCEQYVVRYADEFERMCADPNEYIRVRRKRALVHDASEAYLIDLPAPFKRMPTMVMYRGAEEHLSGELIEWFGLSHDPHNHEADYVKAIDVEIRGTEARQLFRVIQPEWEAKLAPVIPGIQCGTMSPKEAKSAWLAKFWELFPNFKE